jgi:acetamidase/formamidase
VTAYAGTSNNHGTMTAKLRAGTTLYLPVFNEGALFFADDGHAVQGDGEVCITALETGVTGPFRLTVRKDMELRWPFAESATHLMSIGLDEDLDDAAKQAVREMVKHVWPFTSISPSRSMSIPTEIMLVQGAISTAGSAAECRMI